MDQKKELCPGYMLHLSEDAPEANDKARMKVDGSLIAALDLDVGNNDPNRLICLPLDMLGRLLYEKVQKEPLAKVSWSHEVLDLGQDDHRAWIDVKTPENKKRLEADYIVGCDGATSKVRRCLLGPDFPGKTWEVQIVATNVRRPLPPTYTSV